MTKEEGLEKLIKFCNKDLKKGLLSIFNDKSIVIETPRILEDYEKEINLPLPSVLKLGNVFVDNSGINMGEVFYSWKEIQTIVIKNIHRPTNWHEDGKFTTDKYLVFCLNSGEIVETKLDKADYLYNLLRHFIELYRIGA